MFLPDIFNAMNAQNLHVKNERDNALLSLKHWNSRRNKFRWFITHGKQLVRFAMERASFAWRLFLQLRAGASFISSQTCPITDALRVLQHHQLKFSRRWVVFCDEKERQLLRLLLFVFKHTLSKDLIFRIFWCCICRGGTPQAEFEWTNVVLNICKDLRDKFPLHWEKYGASFFVVGALEPSKLVHGHGH